MIKTSPSNIFQNISLQVKYFQNRQACFGHSECEWVKEQIFLECVVSPAVSWRHRSPAWLWSGWRAPARATCRRCLGWEELLDNAENQPKVVSQKYSIKSIKSNLKKKRIKKKKIFFYQISSDHGRLHRSYRRNQQLDLIKLEPRWALNFILANFILSK